MQLPIKRTLERIPGGMMVVPLLLGAMINTLAPEFFKIGGFTTALFKNGALPLIGYGASTGGRAGRRLCRRTGSGSGG